MYKKFAYISNIITVTEYLSGILKQIKQYDTVQLDSPTNLDVLNQIDFRNISNLFESRSKYYHAELKLELRKYIEFCKIFKENLKVSEKVQFDEDELQTFINERNQYEEKFKKHKVKLWIFKFWFILMIFSFYFSLIFILDGALILDDSYYKDLALLNATFSIGAGTLLLTISSLKNTDNFSSFKIIRFISIEFPAFFIINIFLLAVPYLKIPIAFYKVPNLIVLAKLIKIIIITLGLTSSSYIIFKVKNLFES